TKPTWWTARPIGPWPWPWTWTGPAGPTIGGAGAPGKEDGPPGSVGRGGRGTPWYDGGSTGGGIGPRSWPPDWPTTPIGAMAAARIASRSILLSTRIASPSPGLGFGSVGE